MPINVAQGSTIEFTVEFFDANNNLTVPTSATLVVTYPTIANPLVTATTTISMSPSGSFFTATWGTGVAALGLSSASATAPGQTSPTGLTLKVIA